MRQPGWRGKPKTNVMKPVLPILTAFALSVGCAPAMDRFEALSQIETHNNDWAIGRQQEVSRFQILPAYWADAAATNKQIAANARPTDPAAARAVVDWIMQSRCHSFQVRYHRPPNDFEYYILWHRPACYIGRVIPRAITPAENDRATRFASLCGS